MSARVLFVVNDLRHGGAERLVVDLSRGLKARELTPSVLVLFGPGDFDSIIETAGIPLNHLGLGKKMTAENFRTVAKFVRTMRPDIVHAHLPESCWYALPAGLLAGVNHRIAHAHNTHAVWSRKVRFIDRTIGSAATEVVACSVSVARFYHSELYYPRRKLHVVRNGIDLSRYRHLPTKMEARTLLGIESSRTVLVNVGSLTAQKNHEGLVQLVARLRPSVPQILAIIAGEGYRRSELMEYARSLGVSDRVIFAGASSRIPVLLAAADAFVLTSRWEGLPIAVLEAGAAGLPIVATRVGGVSEIIEHGRTGLLVEPGDLDGLAKGIISVLGEPDLSAAMGEAIRQRVQSDFDIERVLDRLLVLYGTRHAV